MVLELCGSPEMPDKHFVLVRLQVAPQWKISPHSSMVERLFRNQEIQIRFLLWALDPDAPVRASRSDKWFESTTGFRWSHFIAQWIVSTDLPPWC